MASFIYIFKAFDSNWQAKPARVERRRRLNLTITTLGESAFIHNIDLDIHLDTYA